MARRIVRRRRFRRRAVRRRRMAIRRGPVAKFDGVVKLKCCAKADLTVSGNVSQIRIFWWNNLVTAVPDYSLDDSVEFQSFVVLFREYRIKYMQIHCNIISNVFPAQNTGTGVAIAFQQVQRGSNVAAIMTEAQLRRCPDFKAYDTDKMIKMNYKVGKFYKSKDVQWLSTATNPIAADLMATQIRIQSTGFANNDVIGHCYITWYAEFRGPVL